MTTSNNGVLDGVRRIGARVRDIVIEGGLPGATAGYRLRGATAAAGPPQAGTWKAGDIVPDHGQPGLMWFCAVAGTPGQWRVVGDQPWQFRPETYGALGNVRAILDAVMASTGSAVLTSATANFTAADTGKAIIVNVGTAGANQAPLITTIASVQSSTQVTLAANPPATAAGNPAIFGSDDTPAINSAITAANSYAVANPGARGQVIFGAKVYGLASATTKGNAGGGGPYYGNALLPIPVTVPLTGANAKINIELVGAGPADETQYWEQKTGQVAGTALVALTAAPSTDGTWGIPSVIGGPTLASGTGFSFTGGFANIRLHVDKIKIVVPWNPGWIGVDARFLAALTGQRYGYQAFAVGVLGGGNGPTINVPSGSWNFNGAGIRFPVMNNNDICDFDMVVIEGVADAIWIADHVTIRMLLCVNNANAIVFDNTNGSGSGNLHGSWIGYASLEAQSANLIITSGTKVTTFPFNIGMLDSENSSTPNDITDTGVLTGTINWYNITSSQPKVSGSTRMKFINNRLSPGLWAAPPAVPGSGTAVAASALPWRDAMVNVQPNGATVTAISIGTAATAYTGITSGFVPVPSGQTVSVTYSAGTPTWQWELF